MAPFYGWVELCQGYGATTRRQFPYIINILLPINIGEKYLKYFMYFAYIYGYQPL